MAAKGGLCVLGLIVAMGFAGPASAHELVGPGFDATLLAPARILPSAGPTTIGHSGTTRLWPWQARVRETTGWWS